MPSLESQLLAWLAIGFLGLSQAQAADYYVSPSGSDNAPGTLSQPFQTIQKAATIMVAGDIAHIRAGVYRETVTPANSGTQYAPITYMPYNGESVTVSGADVIPANSWTLSSGKIYKAPMSWDLGNGANQIFLDGQMMTEAQWPNTTLDVSHPTVALTSGGSYIDGGSGLSTGTIIDPNLPSRPAGYWNGATINICLGECWFWETGPVTDSSTPQQLVFTFGPSNNGLVPGANNAFFLTGLLGELDAPDEWFRDPGTSNLFFWTPLSDNPSGHLVEAKSRQFAFNLTETSFITIQGIGLFAATINSTPYNSYLVLDGLQGQYVSHLPIPAGENAPFAVLSTGIVLWGTNNVLRNSTIAFSSGSGVYLNGTGQHVFNNVIHDTDYRPTDASPIFADAPQAGQGQPLIAYNTIYNSGRSGIHHPNNFGAGRILHNEIYDYGLQTNDLGCDYTYGLDGMGTEIAYNVCHDGHGLFLNNPYPYVAGIYLDAGSSDFVVHHNVAWNVPWGLTLNTPSTNEQVYNNTLIGTDTSFTGGYTAFPYDLTGSVIENNIFRGPFGQEIIGATLSLTNILPGTDPQFVDAAAFNFQLQPTSPAIAAGLVIPPYTNGFSGAAPDIGAYDHTKPPWKAGAQSAVSVVAPSYAPFFTPGTLAVVTSSAPFLPGVSVLVTDGANVDWPATLVYVIGTPPQLAFQVPATTAPGVAMITVTNGDGSILLSSAPVFAGAPPITIAPSQGSGQSAGINSPFATVLQATIKNANGNPMPGVAVTFGVPASGAGGSFTASPTVTTNAAGVAIAPAFTANAVAGSYTVAASAPGVGALALFNLTNNVGAPATITATQGSGQSASINAAFATPLQATVQDAGGNPLPGVMVTFAAPGSGASGVFSNSTATITVAANASGVASASFTATGTQGTYSVTAGTPGVAAPASFALTNVIPTSPITIQTTPAGLPFTVNGGAAQMAPQTLSLPQGKYTIAVITPQPGSLGEQYVFNGWSDGTATATDSITVGASPATYAANFTTQYQLAISASPAAGGTVSPVSGAFYNSGTVVPITATANSGYTFTGWTGAAASAGSASTSVNMGAPETVTAIFSASTQPAFFTGQVSLGAGVEYLQFPNKNIFGYYNFPSSSILYHYDMGFEAFVAGSASDVYLYDFTSGHWWYSSTTLFPYLFDFSLNTWLYYFPDTKNPGHYTTNPRYFSNLTTGQIFPM